MFYISVNFRIVVRDHHLHRRLDHLHQYNLLKNKDVNDTQYLSVNKGCFISFDSLFVLLLSILCPMMREILIRYS